MALQTHTVTLRTEYPGGDPLEGTWSTSVYAFPPLVKDTEGHVVITGKDPEPTDAAGVLVLELEATGQPNLEPSDFRWQISFTSRDRNTRLGPYVFDLTTDRTLDDIAESSGVPVTSAILDQAVTARDEAVSAAAAAAAAALTAKSPLVVNVVDEGVVLDGTTNNAAALQAAADKARTMGRTLHLPAGELWWTGEVKVYTDLRCEATLIHKQSASNTLTIARTAAPVALTTTGLTGLTAGSAKVTGPGVVRGTLELVSTEEVIKRDLGGSTSYTKREASQIAADGTISPPLSNTYNPAVTTATIYPYEPPIAVEVSCKVTGSGTFPHDHLVQVKRDNVTVQQPAASNDTAMTPISFLRVQSCTGVVIDSPRVHGFDNPSEGYGIAVYQSANVEIRDPAFTRCRHSVSGTYAKNLTIRGGEVTVVDHHWVDGFRLVGVTINVGVADTAVGVAGANVHVEDCTINGGRNIVGIREDTPELTGLVRVIRCLWRPGAGATLWAVGFSSNNTATVFAWGRTLKAPDLIDVSDLTIDRTAQAGAASTVVAYNNVAHPFARNAPGRVNVTRLRGLNTPNLSAISYDADPTVLTGSPMFVITDVEFPGAVDHVYIANSTDAAGASVRLRVLDCTGTYIKIPERGMADTLVRGGSLLRLWRTTVSAAASLGTMTLQSVELAAVNFNGLFVFDLRGVVFSGASVSTIVSMDNRIKSVSGGIFAKVGATGQPTRADGYKNATYYI